MMLDWWLMDIEVKKKIFQRPGNEGHSVLKLFLLSVPLILQFFIYFPSCKLENVPMFMFL